VKVRPSSESAYAPRPGLHAPDLIALLALTEQEFRQRFRGSPILRAKRRGFVRNVAVALGNIGNAEAVPALTHALNDEEPLVRGHAAWALGRIGTAEALAGLRRRQGIEADTHVKLEIEEAVSDAEKSCCVVSAKIIGA
jgi:epoxyqueuosine reductase